ncbi:hypothetical protein TrLO_g8402 [Triparma laevis f. longispina]|uniref:Uncharacterized protein n=1 Tax=Triparma laevis f. longispina TaxID=1714387 RepID=A0A9W7B3Q5_9STRA|nr:hypothetical protein TrLO_g8402 [Triparma laevis f. longispina]
MSYSYYSQAKQNLASQQSELNRNTAMASQEEKERRLRLENKRRRRQKEQVKKQAEEKERRRIEGLLKERRKERGLFSPNSAQASSSGSKGGRRKAGRDSVGPTSVATVDDSSAYEYVENNDSHFGGLLKEREVEAVEKLEGDGGAGDGVEADSFIEEDSMCEEDSIGGGGGIDWTHHPADISGASADDSNDDMQSLAMLREQLKNGGVIRPVYENLEGLELGGADDYDYNCGHDYNDESTVVTKTTITTSASMMSDARRAGVNLNQKLSYANNHIKKKSSPPSAPPLPLPPPTSDSRSTNSNNNNTSPKAQWGKGFISSEERQRKELRDKQKNFAAELKEQNKRKIFQQKRVKQQRMIEHQRQVEEEAARVEREGGEGVGVFDYNGSGGVGDVDVGGN